MDRKEFIDMCQVASVKISRYNSFIDVAWNKSELVQYNEDTYYPEKYVLSFDRLGKVRHSVQLHDLKSNSIVIALLDKVERVTC